MAINWIVALKAVPWTDLVQAAPHIVKGARKLFTTVTGRSGGDADATVTPRTAEGRKGVEARLNQLESEVERLHAEQRASAELIRSLAEQNARVVEAMAILRARARILYALSVVLAVALACLAAWVMSR